MDYIDKIYGKVEITEPIIIELMETSAMQRLKGVDQYGYMWPFLSRLRSNRFDHSIGVYLLLQSFGAPLEERVAGLIHDVSHSAFSHCIDYVLSDSSHKQDYQDNIFDHFLAQTEIPEIIRKHGLELEYILNDANLPLKERSLPDLCADRIDYVLRDAFTAGELNEPRKYLDSLIAEDGVWKFKEVKVAKDFAELFLRMNQMYYSGIPTAVMFVSVSEYLKHALAHGYISIPDLYLTDNQVIDKINMHLKDDPQLFVLWQRMNNKIGYKNDHNDYDGSLFCKSRIVDPIFKDEDRDSRVSEAFDGWSEKVKDLSRPKQYFIKFDK